MLAPGGPEWSARLAEWMRGRGRPGRAVSDVEPMTGGTQNSLIRFAFGAADYVLRQPPPAARDGVATIAREARILDALRGTEVPHAALVGVEPDGGVLGDAFLVTEFVAGLNAIGDLPKPLRDRVEPQQAIARAAAEAAAKVASVDPVAVGLSDLGRAADWAERQVARWIRVRAGYEQVAGYPTDSLASAPTVEERLSRRLPRELQFGLVHGDLHLGNMLVGGQGDRVDAIVDWELATLGDVRLDIAHLAVTWPGTLVSWPAAAGWVCTDNRLAVERYAELVPGGLADFAWFQLLASFRMAVLLEGTLVRNLANPVDSGRVRQLHAVAVELLERALELDP